MRRMTVRAIAKPALIRPFEEFLDEFESFEMLDLLKADFERGEKVGLIEARLKEGVTLESVRFPEGYEIISVLKQVGNRYTLIGKIRFPNDFRHILRKFDLNVIWVPPMGRTKNGFVVSVMGKDDDLRKMLDVLKTVGEIEEITFQRASFEPKDLLSCLTAKQKQIVTIAKAQGYYDYPRKINAEELARRIGISKSTALEHLRKAEQRMLAMIFAQA